MCCCSSIPPATRAGAALQVVVATSPFGKSHLSCSGHFLIRLLNLLFQVETVAHLVVVRAGLGMVWGRCGWLKQLKRALPESALLP